MGPDRVIVLTHNPSSEVLDVGREAVCVRHRSYEPPETAPGCLHLTYEELAERGKHAAFSGRDTLVCVGLNKIINPGNRTKVGPHLLRPHPGIRRRISIDRTLFVSEPWRAWFHFGFVGAPYREYTYSYLAETHWRAHQEGLREDDPFGIAAIVECGRGVILSRYDRFFDPLDVKRVEVGEAAHRDYQELKAACFDEEHTASAIIRRLARFAQEVCPERSIPTPARLFTKTWHRVVYTDLGVDQHLVGRLLSLVEMTDAIGREFHAG